MPANQQISCPHCGGLLSIKRARAGWRPPPATAGQFESVAPTAPRGRLTSLLWFMLGRGSDYNARPEDPDRPGRIIIPVRVEQIEGRSWILHDFDERISLPELHHVAQRIIWSKDTWSRANLCRGRQGLSQSKYHIIAGEFRQLNYLHTSRGNKSVLSLRGMAFLRSVLATDPGPGTSNNKQQ